MKILFAGNKKRGVVCLQALAGTGNDIVAVLAHPSGNHPHPPGSVAEVALEMGLPLLQPTDVNVLEMVASLRGFAPELMVLAGYGQILKRQVIEVAPKGCINLHAGKLPQYRGSSPLNWALINGEREFALSLIEVDAGVDSGNVLHERSFPISIDDTIADLHDTANRVFPEMLIEVLEQVRAGTLRPRKQDDALAGYYPLRFPDDGLIFWDLLTSEQIHNRIRALAEPYPCAFTFFDGQRVKLLGSRPSKRAYYGEPGRIYQKKENELLVCASDRCLWIQRAVTEETQEDIFGTVQRYAKFATVRDLAVAAFSHQGPA